MVRLSVVIPCYNGAETLGAQLEALAGQDWDEPWEVIVADNRSTDDSMGIVREYQARMPNLRIVNASAKQGQPYALNAGAAAAAGESLAFCDADDIVGSRWVPAIGDALKRHAFVASRFDFRKLNSERIQRVRKNLQSEGLQPYSNPPFLPHAGGCGLGVRKALHESIGGFDETLPILHDTDYCWRLQLEGVPLEFVSEAVIHIRFRETLSAVYRQARNYGEYNVLLYRRYRRKGMPPVVWRRGFGAWFKLLRALPRLRTERGRLSWARNYGWRVGRLRGCLKYRVLAP